MDKRGLRETIAHHAMAVVGGFFGVYALMNRNATFGSSETTNLIYLFVAGLAGDRREFLIRVVALLVYISGIVFATLIAKCFRDRDFRYVAIVIDIAACLILAQIPEDVNVVLALYPMFFATAVQWLAFTQAAGFSSSTIFSTNNVRQCFTGLTEYLCSHEKKHLLRFCFFGGTLLCFHAGVVYCWFCMRQWGLRSVYACIPLILIGWIATVADRREKRVVSGSQITFKK